MNINIRISEEEKKVIEGKAKALGLTVTSYIKLVSLNSEIKIKIGIIKG